MKTIITVQHPQSIHHTNGMVGSWADWDLSELGLRQAEAIGWNLSKELQGQAFVLYSSDLARARQTAEILGKHLGVQPSFAQALRERNLGKCVGQSVQWLRANRERPERTIDDRLFSDAESRRDEWNRLHPFFEMLLSNGEERIILVSHGDLLSVFNAMWLGLEAEALNRCELFGAAGGVSHLCQTNDGKRWIKKLSDMSYLRP